MFGALDSKSPPDGRAALAALAVPPWQNNCSGRYASPVGEWGCSLPSYPIRLERQQPGQPFTVEFQAIICPAVGHVKHMDHPSASGSRVAQANFGDIADFPAICPLKPHWLTGVKPVTKNCDYFYSSYFRKSSSFAISPGRIPLHFIFEVNPKIRSSPKASSPALVPSAVLI